MSSSNEATDGDSLSELLYHLRHIAEQEAALRGMLDELSAASGAQQRAPLLSRIEIEVIYHLGYHLKELRKPLALELGRAYRALGDEEEPEEPEEL